MKKLVKIKDTLSISKTSKGFTLLELLVVVLIIGMLAGVALPQYRMVKLKAELSRAKQTASDIMKAYELYYTVHNEYPTKFNQLDFVNKFDGSISTGGYVCSIVSRYQEIYCSIGNNKLSYFVNFYTYSRTKIVRQCRANTTDQSDIYNKICQQETGRETPSSSGGTYNNYNY